MMNNRERTNTAESLSRDRMMNNRERTNTAESSSGLRERANTASSVRSIGSLEAGGGGGHLSSLLLNDGSEQGFSDLPSPSRTGRSTSHSSILMSTPSGGGSGRMATTTTIRKIVVWLQKQRVPKTWVQRRRRWSSSSTSADSGSSTSKLSSPSSSSDHHVVYWITGLDRVIWGTSSAAEAVKIAGLQPPRYLWYMLSGAICDVIQLMMDVLLHTVGQIQDASLCWATSFVLSIVFRHTFHRYLVFGDYVGGYWASLLRMYAGYSVIIVLSTVFNLMMTRLASISHYLAWILTLLWTGIANYFILKRIWSFGGGTVAHSSSNVMSASASHR